MKTHELSLFPLLEKVARYRRLYGDEKLRLGAAAQHLHEWFASMDAFEISPDIRDQPILFEWKGATKRGHGHCCERVVFTPDDILFPNCRKIKGNAGELVVHGFSKLSPVELAKFGSHRHDFAAELAYEIDVFFERIERRSRRQGEL